MNKFKVGDLVIGITDDQYSVTNSNVICKVLEVYNSYLVVSCIKTLRKPRNGTEKAVNCKNYDRHHFEVESKYFRKYKDKGNIAIW